MMDAMTSFNGGHGFQNGAGGGNGGIRELNYGGPGGNAFGGGAFGALNQGHGGAGLRSASNIISSIGW